MPEQPAQAGPNSPPPGRVLGLDLGGSRIGVAISDDDRRVAVPLGTVRTGAPQDVRAISALVAENEVTEVVVGLPLSLSGEPGPAADQAEKFAAALRDLLPVPVRFQDERLSTVQAERGLAAAGVDSRGRRGVVDQSAATVILQAYLDRQQG